MSDQPLPGHKKPNHERWVISYADFMTLLFALFVVLFASSTRDRVKMQQEAQGMIAAFHGITPSLLREIGRNSGVLNHQPSPIAKPVENPAQMTPRNLARPKDVAPVHPAVNQKPQPRVTIPVVRPAVEPVPTHKPQLSPPLSQQIAAEMAALAKLREQLDKLLHPLTVKNAVTIQATPLSLSINLNAAILFDSGKATLLPAAQALLTKVAESLKALPPQFTIDLQGYTDNQPIATAQFPSNWSLSAERAVSVVALFAAQHIDGRRLSAQGFGKYAPIADNATAEGRAKNRRVVIVIRAPEVKSPGGGS